MLKYHPFDAHAAEYEKWFEKYPFVFKTELEAIKQLWPKEASKSLEIGCATGRFAKELNILEGIDPSGSLCAIAEERGVKVLHGFAESLPYQSQQFDVILMNFCISYFENVDAALREAFRVLKPGGFLILGFIEKNSLGGKFYEAKKMESVFYKEAIFYSWSEVEIMLNRAGFTDLSFSETLFHLPDQLDAVEPCRSGHDKGSYIFIKASKPYYQ